MSALLAATLAAILSLAGDRPTIAPEQLAHAVTSAAVAGPCPFTGPAAVEACALSLVAIAKTESDFAPRVCNCEVRGDLGISSVGALGCFQLLGPQSRNGHTPAEICADVGLQARLALRVLTMHASQCPRGGPLAAFRGYGGGRCARPAIVTIRDRDGAVVRRFDAGLRQCLTWERLARGAGLVGASCWTRSDIHRAP